MGGVLLNGTFDEFCKNRMISEETQLLFREWFREYLKKHFKFNDNVFNHLIINMSITDISFYWNLFIKDWAKTLEKDE